MDTATEDDTVHIADRTPPDTEKTRLIPEQAATPVSGSADTSAQKSADHIADLYVVKGKIGDGGMGTVFLARDKRLNRYVAIKRLRPQFLEDRRLRSRFIHEAKAAAALNNVHIVHIYAIGEDDTGPYIIMEYVESALPKSRLDALGPRPPQTMEQYVAGNGTFELDDALEFILKVGHAVAAAHAAGVIHRDLKPSNVLMDSAGEPKIVDFGLARLAGANPDSCLTVKGDKFLSLGYGAPEQEDDASTTDERADVYSLGGMLFFALTGKNPRYFREEDIPATVRPIIKKALATDRDARWPNAMSFNAALTTLLSDTKTEKPTVRTTWRCKWCDNLNPLTTRFCGECGWDGGEPCRECGADMHIGIQFCGACGANARDYESAAILLEKIRKAVAARQYDVAANAAGQPLTFEPVGATGREMLSEIHSLGVLSRNKLERREQLRDIIANELSLENYERAQRFIAEFQELSPSPKAYDDVLKSIQGKIARRDLLRVQKSFKSQDWDAGERMLAAMTTLEGVFREEKERLVKALRHHKRRVFLRHTGITLIALFILYILATPLAALAPRNAFKTIWRPAARITKTYRIEKLMTRYAALFGVTDLYAALEPTAAPRPLAPAPRPASATPKSPDAANPETLRQLAQMETDYRRQIREYADETSQNETEWAAEYRQMLEDLRENYRRNGNFNGWKTVDDELTRFDRDRDFAPDIQYIAGDNVAADAILRTQNDSRLRKEHRIAIANRKHVTATRRYIDQLEKHVRDLTIQGSMREAEQYSQTLHNIRNAPDYLLAEQKLREYDATYPAEFTEIPHRSDYAAELSTLRDTYTAERDKIRDAHNADIGRWEDAYLQALKDHRANRQTEGDFTGWQLTNKEINRFELNRTIPDPPPDTEHRPLDHLRAKHLASRAALENKRDNDLLAALAAIDKTLLDFISRHTKAGNTDAAAVAAAERRRFDTLPEIVAARQRIEERTQNAPK